MLGVELHVLGTANICHAPFPQSQHLKSKRDAHKDLQHCSATGLVGHNTHPVRRPLRPRPLVASTSPPHRRKDNACNHDTILSLIRSCGHRDGAESSAPATTLLLKPTTNLPRSTTTTDDTLPPADRVDIAEVQRKPDSTIPLPVATATFVNINSHSTASRLSLRTFQGLDQLRPPSESVASLSHTDWMSTIDTKALLLSNAMNSYKLLEAPWRTVSTRSFRSQPLHLCQILARFLRRCATSSPAAYPVH